MTKDAEKLEWVKMEAFLAEYRSDKKKALESLATYEEGIRYLNAGDLDAGTPSNLDHSKRGFEPQ